MANLRNTAQGGASHVTANDPPHCLAIQTGSKANLEATMTERLHTMLSNSASTESQKKLVYNVPWSFVPLMRTPTNGRL